MSSALSSTIGEQKALNWALQPLARADFVAAQTEGLTAPPRYFPASAELNRTGAPALDELPAVADLSPAEVAAQIAAGALVLDVRDKTAFGAGHLPGAVNIGLGGSFASWAGTLLDGNCPLVLVADDEQRLAEARLRLARVGLHAVVGALAGGLPAWAAAGRPLATLPQLTADELRRRLDVPGGRVPFVLDVRRRAEHVAAHVPGALNIPVDELQARLGELDRGRPTAVICATGYRSSAAASLLARAGFRDLANVAGGTVGWIEAGHPTEASAPASST